MYTNVECINITRRTEYDLEGPFGFAIEEMCVAKVSHHKRKSANEC